jgi:hypothetical protein
VSSPPPQPANAVPNPQPGGPNSGSPGAPWRRAPSLWLALILVSSLVPRLPVLVNAEHSFNSDEAVNALVIKRLVEKGELALHNWDATYYGIVEGLLAIPFVAVTGFTPLAFKLSALTGFLLLIVSTCALGHRLYGPGEGLMAAALLAAFSPQLVLWSTLASGGYTLVIAWGTLTLWCFAGMQRAADGLRLRRLLLFGAMLGFGLYIYELYLVYVALFAAYAAGASFPWRAARAPERVARRAALRGAPLELGRLAVLLAGMAIGWAPKLSVLWSGAGGSKRPLYQLATGPQLRQNLELLFGGSLPAFFGVNLTGSPEVARWVGPPWRFGSVLGWLLVTLYAGFFAWGARRAWPRFAALLRRPPGDLDTEALLVLLVPLVAVAFVLSPNPQDVLASRYLLPWLSSLPLFAGTVLVQLARAGGGGRLAATATAAFLVALPAVHIVREHQVMHYVGTDLRLTRTPEPLAEVVRFLRQRGIEGAYGTYWTAYEATFLAGEELVVAPFLDWDRYPPYSDQVRRLDNVAYVFAQPRGEAESRFLERLQREGRPYEETAIGPYRIYTSPRRERLLPRHAFESPRPLARPRAQVLAGEAPARVAPGEIFEVDLRATNTGGEPWSAAGAGAGTYRVAAAYHWLDERGEAVVFDGARTLLPEDVPPGGSVEVRMRLAAPARPGDYELVLTLVQESVAWFDQIGAGASRLRVRVSER